MLKGHFPDHSSLRFDRQFLSALKILQKGTPDSGEDYSLGLLHLFSLFDESVKTASVKRFLQLLCSIRESFPVD